MRKTEIDRLRNRSSRLPYHNKSLFLQLTVLPKCPLFHGVLLLYDGLAIKFLRAFTDILSLRNWGWAKEEVRAAYLQCSS